MPKKNLTRNRPMARRYVLEDSHDRVLVVCEGERTEPFYFNGIRIESRLSPKSVCILGAGKTDPMQIVEIAEQLFLRGNPHEEIPPGCFDRIYAVFDRDTHAGYKSALEMTASLNNSMKNDEGTSVPFEAVPSSPCFELWLLLHYEDVTSLLSCSDAEDKLKQHFEDYRKNHPESYARTKDNIPDAIKRALRLERTSSPTSEEEPYTAVHKLVEVLHKLKR